MGFVKAVKTKQKLRLAIDGVSRAGKTYTALAVASGMGERIAVIDTEHGSASLYADTFDFDTMELRSFQIEDYLAAIDEASAAGYEILIIDSTSHAWDALTERVERIALAKFGGNTFRAWAEGTALQKKLIEKMLAYPGHIIATCRSKTDYSVQKDEKGKTSITKIGLAAVQRAGFEYEFTLTISIDINHVSNITKDRTGKFQDRFIEKPGADFGAELVSWLAEGAMPAPAVDPDLARERKAILEDIKTILDVCDAKNANVFTSDERDGVREFCKLCGTHQAGLNRLMEKCVILRQEADRRLVLRRSA